MGRCRQRTGSLLRSLFQISYFQIKTNLTWNLKSLIDSWQHHTALLPDLGLQHSTAWLRSTRMPRHSRGSTWILSWRANTLSSTLTRFSPSKLFGELWSWVIPCGQCNILLESLLNTSTRWTATPLRVPWPPGLADNEEEDVGRRQGLWILTEFAPTGQQPCLTVLIMYCLKNYIQIWQCLMTFCYIHI